MVLERLKAARFQTKVLVPVAAVMVTLVAITMWVVNTRITRQLQKEATHALATSDAVFKNSQKIRAKNLLLRFRNIATEPRYRAACQLKDGKTLEDLLDQLLDEESDLVQYVTKEGETIATASLDRSLDIVEFSNHSALATKQALQGSNSVDTIRVGDRLFDIVSVPVSVNDEIIGALTFCTHIADTEAREFSQLTGSGIVLLANGQVAASSLERRGLYRQCLLLFGNTRGFHMREAGAISAPVREIVLPQEHFLALVGRFESMSGDPMLGYVLLYSYEQPLRELRATQQTIIAVSVTGIVLGTLLVWFLIRNATKPLRQLRDSAEAVGRGDFSRRVMVNSKDECGQLADVFNHMTENLQVSREKLEQTVSSLKNTQAQLVQSEKLSAIGEFVAGVTHELNNPLTALLGFSELLIQTKVDERQRRFAERILSSAQRCVKIVQSLLSFARQHPPERKVSNLNELVEAVIEIMAYEMRTSNIELLMELDPALPKTMVDPHQVQQVFLNLVNNARQAMEANQHAGRLRIRTEGAYGRVRVTFQDNGPGISDTNLKKIFDPFFTTKEAGKGTGLGLSLSYGIIQEHGGTIRAESRVTEGATFIIELPAHVETAANPTHKEALPELKPRSYASGNGKHVLVVDDEDAILDFVSEVLAADGYEVDAARDGESALHQLRQKRYDFTLCDWKMPGLSGQKLFERVNTEDGQAAGRFIFMTGDLINGKIQAFLKQHQRPCLSKPFSISEFRSAVRELAQAA